MELKIVSITIIVFPAVESPVDVKLVWETVTDPNLLRYLLYQAPFNNQIIEKWSVVANLSKDLTTFTALVEFGKNYAWRVSPINKEGRWITASNSITLYSAMKTDPPVNLIKQLGGYLP